MPYQYKPEVDAPVADLHMTDPGVLQLKVYGVTVDGVQNPREEERNDLEAKAKFINERARDHPDRQELRECRAANEVAIPAMRSLGAAYQRLLKVIERTPVAAIMRKGMPSKTASSFLKAETMLKEGDKLYRDQFVLPAHMLYTLQRNLHLLQHQIENSKCINLDLVTDGLELVEKTMTHYGIEVPTMVETETLFALSDHGTH